MDIQEVAISDIQIGARLRQVKDAKVREISESIAQVGLLSPVELTEEFKLVFGRHRLAAVQRLGWTTIPANIRAYDSLHAELAEIDENLYRNELTVLEQGEHLERRKEIYEALNPNAKAEARRAAGMNKALGNNVAPVSGATFVESVEALTGKSKSAIKEEIQIARDIAEPVKDLIRDTELADKKTELLSLARMEPEKQQQAAEMLVSGEAKSVKDAARLIRRAEVAEVAVIPSGKFRVVYADPPWKYGDGLTENYGGTQYHYPSMTISELCDMPVVDMAEDNAVLFLWVTSPLLEDCFPIIKAWGFKYKASFVWDKVKHNMGHYNSVRHEFLLVCTRGSCTPDVSKLYDSVQSIERSDKHSEKPEEFRQIIDTIYPHGARLELFARKDVEGWEAYGNQRPTV